MLGLIYYVEVPGSPSESHRKVIMFSFFKYRRHYYLIQYQCCIDMVFSLKKYLDITLPDKPQSKSRFNTCLGYQKERMFFVQVVIEAA